MWTIWRPQLTQHFLQHSPLKDQPSLLCILPPCPRPFMQTTVTSAEVITASPSTDSYSFKGVFKALASVAEAAGNLCNKSPGWAKRLSDRSADTNAVPAADTTRQGELGVRLTEGDGLKHICCRCWSAQTDGIHSISGCCCRGRRRRRRRWGGGTFTVVSVGLCQKQNKMRGWRCSSLRQVSVHHEAHFKVDVMNLFQGYLNVRQVSKVQKQEGVGVFIWRQ